jgi:hypothetical protein
MASFIDNLDIFRTSFTFSNRTSSIFSKMFTLSYVVLFIYFSTVSLINITVDNKIEVTNVFTYEDNYTTNLDTYKQMNIILYMQIYSNDSTTLDEKETLQLIDTKLDIKVFSINSFNNKYQTNKLSTFKCGQNQSILIYCLTYDINSMSDFLTIAFDKPVLLPQSDFDQYLADYTIRYHVDYYFTKAECDKKNFFKVGDIHSYLLKFNEVFKDNGLFGYLSNTYGSFKLIFNNRVTNGDYVFSFNILRLALDASVLLQKSFYFEAFQYNNMVTKPSHSLLSFTFKVMPLAQSYYFNYKKLQTSLAEIGGILNVVKFIGVTIILLINFVKQHSYIASQFYNNKIIFKERSSAKVLTPFDNSTSKVGLTPNELPVRLGLGVKSKTRNNIELSSPSKLSEGHEVNFLNSKFIHKKLSLPINLDNTLSEKEQLRALLRKLKVNLKNSFNIVSFLKIICLGYCLKARRTKFNIYRDMISENLKKMDFIYFMEKIKQIDILSYLLLDESQQVMMELVEKEQVIYDTAQKRCYISNKWSTEKFTESDKLQKLCQFVNKFRNNTCSELDKKFLEIINKEVAVIGKLKDRT